MVKKNLELQLIGEKVNDESKRIKAVRDLLHAYRFDDYNDSPSEQFITIDLNKDEFDEMNKTGVSAKNTLARVLEEAPETALIYAWWKHYYTYFPEFTKAYSDLMSKIDTIPPINSFEIIDEKGREKFVDNELANAVESEMLNRLKPKLMQEFLIKLTAEYRRRFHATQCLSMSLSGYTLFDEFTRVGLPKISELSGWLSPEELATKKHEEDLEAQKKKELADYNLKVEKAKKILSVRYTKAVSKYIETLAEAYSKLRSTAGEDLSEVKAKKRIEHFNSVLDGIRVKAISTFKSNNWDEDLGIDWESYSKFEQSLQSKSLSNVEMITRVVLNQTSKMFWDGITAGFDVVQLKREMLNVIVK